jgi:hypothetical protein
MIALFIEGDCSDAHNTARHYNIKLTSVVHSSKYYTHALCCDDALESVIEWFDDNCAFNFPTGTLMYFQRL